MPACKTDVKPYMMMMTKRQLSNITTENNDELNKGYSILTKTSLYKKHFLVSDNNFLIF